MNTVLLTPVFRPVIPPGDGDISRFNGLICGDCADKKGKPLKRLPLTSGRHLHRPKDRC